VIADDRRVIEEPEDYDNALATAKRFAGEYPTIYQLVPVADVVVEVRYR